jgi:hypothetical protein
MKDLAFNAILIFDLQMINKSMNNNYKSEGFEIQRFDNNLSGVSTRSVEVFT